MDDPRTDNDVIEQTHRDSLARAVKATPKPKGTRMEKIRSIVEGHQASRVEGLFVDSFTANMLVKVHAALIEVNCTTDFVARSEDFRTFVDEVAMQVAAMNPRWVSNEDIPKDAVDKQAEIFTEQLRGEGKPEKAWAKIVGGKLTKWYSETCLLDQESVMHPKQTIEQVRVALVAKIGENVKIRRFVRWEVGEGIERAAREDYAAEVARLAGS